MNMAVNPLMSQMGGGSMQRGDLSIQSHGKSFSGLIETNSSSSMQQQNELTDIAAKASAALARLLDLEATDLDLSDISLEDLALFLAGELDALEVTGEGDAELASLMQTLAEIQEMLRDLIDFLPDVLAEIAPQDMGLDQAEVVNFAAIIEVVTFLRDSVMSQASLSPQPGLLQSNPHLQVVRAGGQEIRATASSDVRSLQALSLMSDVDGIAVPEANLKDALTLTPPAALVLRTVATAVMQVQKSGPQAVDFEASETPLALMSRADQPQFEPIERPQVQQPRAENQISTKFANVLVNQVRQVDFQEGTTRIELSPRGLGNIEVEMRTNSDGSLAVVVRAENDAVLSALREEHDLLAAIIGDSDTGSLDFQEYSQEQNSDQSGSVMAGVEEDDVVDAGAADTNIVNGPQLDLVT